MEISTRELAGARETVQAVLEELGLSAYLFEVEFRNEAWEVRVDCATDALWQSATLTVSAPALEAAARPGAGRRRLMGEWAPQLAACTGTPPGS